MSNIPQSPDQFNAEYLEDDEDANSSFLSVNSPPFLQSLNIEEAEAVGTSQPFAFASASTSSSTSASMSASASTSTSARTARSSLRQPENEGSLDDYIEVLNKYMQKKIEDETENDDDAEFGKIVSYHLKKAPDEETKKRIRRKIMNIFLDENVV